MGSRLLFFRKLAPLLLLTILACKKDKPNITVSFCNGGMVPDTVTFIESNLSGDEHIWQLFGANGTALANPVNTGAINSIFGRFDSAGTFRVKIDVNNESSTEVTFTLKDFISEGTERGVSFFDSDRIVWTVYPDSDCHAAVRVKETNGEGGIDYYAAENKIVYVPLSIITCFPNGEDLEEVESPGFSLQDIVVVQSTGEVFIGAFDGDLGEDVILQTTFDNIPALANNSFTARFPVTEDVKQLAFDPVDRVFYFVNEDPFVHMRDATPGGQTISGEFGSALEKTAIVYDIGSRRVVFAEGIFDCTIVIVDPAQPDDRILEFSVPCDGRVNGIDLDEDSDDLVYTDGESIWMVNLNQTAVVIPLVISNNRTIRKDDVNFNTPLTPPINDVVIAQYSD